MRLRYRALAGVVFVVHFGFVLFVVAGPLAVLWKPWLAWLHIPCVAYGAGIEFIGGTCPLTRLENRFRRAAGEPDYGHSFLGHYIGGAVDPVRWARIEPWLGAALLVGNVAIYGFLLSTATS
jgi:hypothetical protein